MKHHFTLITSTNKSSPKSFGKSASLPLKAENALARFLRVQLAAQYPLQTSPITRPRQVRNIHRAVPHASYKLHCAVGFPLLQKRFAPSLTRDINAQCSHWNNGKMKIAYNSAMLCQTPNINVQADYFLPIMSDCKLIASKRSIGYGRSHTLTLYCY